MLKGEQLYTLTQVIQKKFRCSINFFCVYIQLNYNYRIMKRYAINYTWLPILFLTGCVSTSTERWRDIDRRVVELSKTTQSLERKIDDLSRSISLIVLDGNELHNEMYDVKTSSKDIQKKIEGVETELTHVNNHIGILETTYKDMEKGINKRIDDIQKAEIELSNRLEIMKLDIKEGGKEGTASLPIP